MTARVIIEKDGNGYSAFIDGIKSTVIGEGASVEEAKADLDNSWTFEARKASTLSFDFASDSSTMKS